MITYKGRIREIISDRCRNPLLRRLLETVMDNIEILFHNHNIEVRYHQVEWCMPYYLVEGHREKFLWHLEPINRPRQYPNPENLGLLYVRVGSIREQLVLPRCEFSKLIRNAPEGGKVKVRHCVVPISPLALRESKNLTELLIAFDLMRQTFERKLRVI